MNKYIIILAAAALLIAAAALNSCKDGEKPQSVTVGPQSGAMTAGETQSVTFAVTTANIADGPYDALVANRPAGVTVQGQVTISAGSGTLTLAGSAATTAGSADNLTLTIDRATSKAFSLTITAATYSIDATPNPLLFGVLAAGYAQPAAQTVTVTNTGTGTVTLSDLPVVENYALTPLSTTTLVAGATATFTVRPDAGLELGTYNRDIVITGSNGVNATVKASFDVNTYAISAEPLTLEFGPWEMSYTQPDALPDAQTVTVTNTGTGTVMLNPLPEVAGYAIGALSASTLAAGATATFTVQPKAGLAAGTYNASIAVTGSNGANATVQANLVVTAPEPVLTVSPETRTVAAAASTFEVKVTANVPWTVTSDQTSWCAVSPANGNGDGVITVTMSAYNEGADNRVAKLAISAAAFGLSREVTVTQTPPPKTFTYTATAGEGGTISPSGAVEITQGENKTFTARPNSGKAVDEWIVNSKVVATSGNTYTVRNVQADGRIEVTFQDADYAPVFPQKGGALIVKDGTETPVFLNNILNITSTFYEFLGRDQFFPYPDTGIGAYFGTGCAFIYIKQGKNKAWFEFNAEILVYIINGVKIYATRYYRGTLTYTGSGQCEYFFDAHINDISSKESYYNQKLTLLHW